MVKRKSTSDTLKHFKVLEQYISKVSKGDMRRHSMYSLCVRASITKCYEFNLAVPHIAKSENTFFAMATLRGICEDLIVLRYIKGMPRKDQQTLLSALASHELSSQLKRQGVFFNLFRPQQPVLRLKDPDASISASEALARSIWNKHGWPKLNSGALPQIRQIAEKQGLHHLAVLYDYLYRLTSAAVHFNVSSFLRSGWGKHVMQPTFSTKNFHAYYEEYCSLYGAFMFCLYFEFFALVLRPSPSERQSVDEIRKSVLYTRRWPEMVTYEEMNQKQPEVSEMMRMMVSAIQAVSRTRLITKPVNYKNKRSAEQQTLNAVMQAMRESRPAKPNGAKTPSGG